MRALLGSLLLLPLLLTACASADAPASRAVVTRFHVALNTGNWPAIDALLSQSSRDLHPGTARAFRAITARHGYYLGGELAAISADRGRTYVAWAARYERGPVQEAFVLIEEGGSLKIDSYTDKPQP